MSIYILPLDEKANGNKKKIKLSVVSIMKWL